MNTIMDYLRYHTHNGEITTDLKRLEGRQIPLAAGEFWTSGQRQASSLHEISYRACFKPQLPSFFINMFTKTGDRVHDPFMGRGTTPLEAGLTGRKPSGNDVNPLGKILVEPRFDPPTVEEVGDRLNAIDLRGGPDTDPDLSMFYHPETLREIMALRGYLIDRKKDGEEDGIDRWIRMVATNRLTGHSPGFFSAYTLPPNQSTSRERQVRINSRRGQKPAYREIKPRIIKKTRSLLRNLARDQLGNLKRVKDDLILTASDARNIKDLETGSVDLTVTSPPFLDVVQYKNDNWLRAWFNGIESDTGDKITMERGLEGWKKVMKESLSELRRVTGSGGIVAFEVGEVRKGSIKLDEIVLPLGMDVGFETLVLVHNVQNFTKTSNIWGVDNNRKGTNTNRIAIMKST